MGSYAREVSEVSHTETVNRVSSRCGASFRRSEDRFVACVSLMISARGELCSSNGGITELRHAMIEIALGALIRSAWGSILIEAR